MNGRFRHLAAVTTGSTFVLILLGLYTGATAGGLSCSRNWPHCNGWLGLFPGDWASFFEWSHRLVAMIVGFMLLAMLYGAWRRQDDPWVRRLVTAALAILPIQVTLGAVTTTANGWFPQGFNPAVMAFHFSTATTIFAFLVVATVRTFDRPSIETARLVTAGSLGLLVVHTVTDFTTPLDGLLATPNFVPSIQMAYYGSSFAVFAAMLALAYWFDDRPRLRQFSAVTAVVLAVDMLLSRGLLGVPSVVADLTTVAVVLGTVVLLIRLYRTRLTPPSPSQQAN